MFEDLYLYSNDLQVILLCVRVGNLRLDILIRPLVHSTNIPNCLFAYEL